MQTVEHLIKEAASAEALAEMVSYAPDRARLLAMAARLREEAHRRAEDRSWSPPAKRP
jgi:hypothetical protein